MLRILSLTVLILTSAPALAQNPQPSTADQSDGTDGAAERRVTASGTDGARQTGA